MQMNSFSVFILLLLAFANGETGYYLIGAWSTCSKPCDGGSMSRTVECVSATSSGTILPDTDCAGIKPDMVKTCNIQDCPAEEVTTFSCTGGSNCSVKEKMGGELTFSVVEAKNLPNLDSFGPFADSTDCFVIVSIGDTKRTSSVVRNSLNPVWSNEGYDMNFGVQASETAIALELWDEDYGLEFSSDYIGSTSTSVIACSMFNKGKCAEESWIPLEGTTDCSLEDAVCIKVRMAIVAFTLRVDSITEPSRSMSSTVAYPFSLIESGHWGLVFEDDGLRIDADYYEFEDAQGGLILRNLNGDKDLVKDGTYITASINYPAYVYIFRKVKDSLYTPSWLDDWDSYYSRAKVLGTSGSRDDITFKSHRKWFAAGSFELGYPRTDSSVPVPLYQYIIVAKMDIYADPPEPQTSKSFDRAAFFDLIVRFGIMIGFFGFLAIRLIWKMKWRFDRIPSWIMSHDKDKDLLGLVVEHYNDPKDQLNVKFKRFVFYAECGIKLFIGFPLVLFLVFGLVLFVNCSPSTLGFALMTVGVAVILACVAFNSWKQSSWIMNRSVLLMFMISLALCLMFMVFCVFADPHIVDRELSLRSLGAIGFTLNMLPMALLVFSSDQNMNESIATIRETVAQQAELLCMKATPSTLVELVGDIYSINMTDFFRWNDSQVFFAAAKSNSRRLRRLYAAALCSLVLYAVVVCFAKSNYWYIGLLNVGFTLLLDSSFYLLSRGWVSWKPGTKTTLMIFCRIFLVIGSGDHWLAGFSVAFLIIGIALCFEIVGQRLPQITNSQAAAIVYFGKSSSKNHKKDVAGFPEFVLGYLSFFFITIVLTSVFVTDSDNVPSVSLFNVEYDVWVFGIAAFLCVLVVGLALSTQRAFTLVNDGLLKNESYLFFEWFRLQWMLSAMTELFVVTGAIVLWALTDATVIIEIAVFVPFIAVSGFRAALQWAQNDYQLLQPKALRSGFEETLNILPPLVAGEDPENSNEVTVLPILEDKVEIDENPEDGNVEANDIEKTDSGNCEIAELGDWDSFWKRKCTTIDYATVFCLVICFLSVFFLGMTVSIFENPAWIGQALWSGVYLLFFSSAAIIKIYKTYQVTIDFKILCGLTAFLLLFGGLSLWAIGLEMDLNHDLTLGIVVFILMYPSILAFVAVFLKWRDEDWVWSSTTGKVLGISMSVFFWFDLILWLWAGSPYVSFSILLLLVGVTGIIWTLRKWADSDYYLPTNIQTLLRRILIISACVFLCIGLIVPVDVFYSISISFILIIFYLACGTAATIFQRKPNCPVVFSTFGFPVFSYDPETNGTLNEFSGSWNAAAAVCCFFLWGLFCCIFVDPIFIGISITCVVVTATFWSIIQIMATHQLKLASSCRFVDQYLLNHCAEEARTLFFSKQKAFISECPEFAERDRREEIIQNRLNRYNADRITDKSSDIGISAKEGVANLRATLKEINTEGSLLSFREACQEAFINGSGPFGWIGARGFFYKNIMKLWKKKVVSLYSNVMSKTLDLETQSTTPIPDLLKVLVEQDAELAKAYERESEASIHFLVLIIVACDSRLRREGVLFQKFLREYRFKLISNGVNPPARIFKSQSLATVDIKLVATWLMKLSAEQQERFHLLKARFSEEQTNQFLKRLQEDEASDYASQQLQHLRQQQEFYQCHKRWQEFQERKEIRRQKGIDESTLPDSEEVVNVKERLQEIVSGNGIKRNINGRQCQFVDPEFPHSANSVGPCFSASLIAGWQHGSNFNQDTVLFADGTDPDDVFQGQLYDAWLLSAISIVSASGGVGDSEVDELVANLFLHTPEATDVGAYAVRLWMNGQYEVIFLLNYCNCVCSMW
eukprot:TRINITY_DN3169_c0_g1_i2.p1 TRINITY_DN3169_c0_g1~~TRINITY_DN3169_c0_g1_i2.p1  ORF type:complete len:1822 (+),score=281.91 TRINITY_DN3169_c0_g1_i2:100-5565(+)